MYEQKKKHTKAKAYSPSHITGFFYIVDNENHLYKGAVGCGIVLKEGCITLITDSDDFSIRINGREEEAKTTRYVVKRLSNSKKAVAVSTNFDVPIGCGFGASGGGALSTALALKHFLGLHMTLNEVAQVAHCAEVENSTGLGDVTAETYGGVVIREKAGPPGIGMVDKIPCASEEMSISYVVLGKISTKEILKEKDMRGRINEAGRKAMKELKRKPTLENFMLVSRRFSIQTEIISDKCKDVIEAVEAEGRIGTAAMISNTVFVVGKNEVLSKFGEVKKSWISHIGARVVNDRAD